MAKTNTSFIHQGRLGCTSSSTLLFSFILKRNWEWGIMTGNKQTNKKKRSTLHWFIWCLAMPVSTSTLPRRTYFGLVQVPKMGWEGPKTLNQVASTFTIENSYWNLLFPGFFFPSLTEPLPSPIFLRSKFWFILEIRIELAEAKK